MLDILNLGTLPEYDDHSVAWGVSENGGIVVGYAQNASGCPWAFRWNEKDGMGDLDPPRSGSQAYGVSRNGRLIVGVFDGRAVIWKPKDKGENLEMHKLNTWVSSNLARFSRLEVARAISLAEYSYYIVGWGYNSSTRRTEAFLLQQG
jgi:probable HAF family extracellular repeat protein